MPASRHNSSNRIRLSGVSKRLPSGGRPLTILDGIDLEIAAGESVAILGPSGSGKSTLLGLMAGLDRPSEGRIEIDGTPIQDLSEDALARLRRRTIGFVFQSFQLLNNLTARENILLPLELIEASDAHQRTDALLEAVDLADRGHHYPAQLSGGEQQRIALARAFAARPAILLADEPTGNLDRSTGDRILDLLFDYRDHFDTAQPDPADSAERTTLVVVTHDQQVAARADRRIYLIDGRIDREETKRPAGPAPDRDPDPNLNPKSNL